MSSQTVLQVPLLGLPNALGNRAPQGVIAVEDAERNPGFYTIIRNKRGNVVRALVRGRDMATVPLSNNGVGYEQRLNSGWVWALRGTPGS